MCCMDQEWETQFTLACDRFAQAVRALGDLEEEVTDAQDRKLLSSLESLLELRKILITGLGKERD